MKKVLRTILIIVLVLAVLGTGFWYFFIHQSRLPASLYATYAGWVDHGGRHGSAARFYSKAMELEPSNIDYAIKAAEAYQAAGNYTKAEYTLVYSIGENPDALPLYLELSSVYVAQDKLLDAERLISACANESIKEQLTELRPAAPVIQPEGGFSLEPTTFSLAYSGGNAYYSLTEEYPSMDKTAYSEPVTLDYGVTTVSAILVGENGLVSPLSTAEFTVCGEIEEVTFEDEAFDEMIRDLLGKGRHSTILSSELWTISEMEIPSEITNLSDLVYFVGLKSLTLQNSTADLSPLASLPSLTALDLTGTPLDSNDITAIGSAATLGELYLSGCGIASIDALAGLSQLTVLDLSDNQISDITALAGMPSLTELNLSGNQVSSITPLTAAAQLSVLNLSGNPIDSLGAISANTVLTELSASGCGISDLSPLENKTALTVLDISDNELEEIDTLQGCSSLTDLDLSGNRLSDLSPITGLPALTNLDASENQLEESPQFPEGAPLITLNLSFNSLTEVDGLTELHQLNYLCLNDNRLTDISAVADLASLLQVDAYRNPLVGVASLEERSILVNYDPGYVLPDEPDEADSSESDAEETEDSASSGTGNNTHGITEDDLLTGRVESVDGG